MHYYQRNIGAYATDTGHLTVIEHGLYTLLLDWYYKNERPITEFEVKRISRGHRDEALTVLCEFFKETEQGWIHSYADRVIAEYHAKAEKNRQNGQSGGRPPANRNPEETQSVSSRTPTVTLTNNNKPITNNQKIKSTVPPAVAPDYEYGFSEAWEIYPKRGGGNSKADALKQWKTRRREGVSVEALLAGTRRYAALITATGKERTELVKMASTFYGVGRHFEDDFPIPLQYVQQAGLSKSMQTLQTLQAMRNGNELATGRNHSGFPALGLSGPGPSTGIGVDRWDGDGVE